MILCLFDTTASRNACYPFSLTRPVADIRFGMMTIKAWWQFKSGLHAVALTGAYMQQPLPDAASYLCVDASVHADEACMNTILQLPPGHMLEDEAGLIAFHSIAKPVFDSLPIWFDGEHKTSNQRRIHHASYFFQQNEQAIREQFNAVTAGRVSAVAGSTNTIIAPQNVFIEEGVQMEACVVSGRQGPVYIGKNAIVMEGAMLHGPVCINEGAVVKMGAKIYPGTTIGPYCAAGGEIKNSIMLGYCNKAHDGYLGDSIIGEWCNLGAGTTNSNVKNTGGLVNMWSEAARELVPVGMKAGLLMGDHSRSAINTSFNTGTVLGVCCNVFDGNYPPKHLPSFSWGNFEKYTLEMAFTHISNWKKMKGQQLSEAEKLILQHIFNKQHPQL